MQNIPLVVLHTVYATQDIFIYLHEDVEEKIFIQWQTSKPWSKDKHQNLDLYNWLTSKLCPEDEHQTLLLKDNTKTLI